MKIINIRMGIIGFIIGSLIIVLFNQKLTEIIGQGETEIKVILYATWVLLCVLIAGYAPIGITIEDTDK